MSIAEVTKVAGQRPLGDQDPPLTVVTGADLPAGAITSALLTRRGHRVIGLDAPPVDRNALLAAQRSIPTLVRLVRDSGAGLVIPTIPGELQELSAARSLLEQLGARVMIAGAGPVALVSDHLFALSHLQSRAVPVPRFVLPATLSSLHDALEMFGGSVLAVPRSKACAGRPLLLTGPEHDGWDRLDDDWVLQEVLPGEHYRVLVHRPAQGSEGRLAVVVHDPLPPEHRWTRWATPGSVPTASRTVHPAVERAAMAAIRATGLTGRATVEVTLDASGAPHVTGIDAAYGPHLRLAPELLDLALEAEVNPPQRAHLQLQGARR